MNVYQLDDMSWEYQFGDKSIKAQTLKELEVLVSLYGLKWRVLDNNLAEKSLEIDKNNVTGFLIKAIQRSYESKSYKPAKNSSHSFQQRTYDWDKLEQLILSN